VSYLLLKLKVSNLLKIKTTWACWDVPVIPALGKAETGFEASLGYIVKSCLYLSK
jgi:hypothetical protein